MPSGEPRLRALPGFLSGSPKPSTMKTTHVLLLLLTLTVSCVTPASRSDGSTPAAQIAEPAVLAAEESPKQSDSERKQALEVAGLEMKLEEAQLALELAEMQIEQDRAKIQRKGLEAERDVNVARDKWAHFRDVESTLMLSKTQLDVDRAISRLESKRQDLIGILEIYEGEVEASAKDEIIRRNRKGVEFAQQVLEQERLKARLVAEFEVPQKLESLQWDLSAAEAEKQQAEVDQGRAELKTRLALLEAHNQIQRTQQELEMQQAKLAQLKVVVESGELSQ
ncbi:MAG: hypothetical protein ACI9X4_001172 [Glaciecola sp.]|jgi:hypothetical protein